MKRWMLSLLGVSGLAGLLPQTGAAPVNRPPSPSFDARPALAARAPRLLRAPGAASAPALSEVQANAVNRLQQGLPDLVVEADLVTGSPRLIASRSGFLTGPRGAGGAISAVTLDQLPANDPHRVVKAFLTDNADLFGHGAEALANARVMRDYVTGHNGLRTVIWEQRFQDVPVFAGLLQAFVTAQQELVRVSSQFVPTPDAAAATGAPDWANILARPITAASAIAYAAGAANINVAIDPAALTALGAMTDGTGRQKFKAPPLKGITYAGLSWLPLDPSRLRLCWVVYLASRVTGEGFRVLVDAQTGQVWMSHNLTRDQAAPPAVNLSAYTSDSPSPFSPGWSAPSIMQPPTVPRTYLTNFAALDLAASPAGWFYPATNGYYITVGNNVDAHTDLDDDDNPDVPRPAVPVDNPDFTFPLDLTQAPLSYTNASVVNLFYWCNFMHDRTYEYGFTEPAGNYQTDNFGKGGFGDDAVQADAMDGAGLNDPFFHMNNAYFMPAPDGIPGRIAMFLWDGPQPDRDGDLDAEVICHEYTHGVSERLVGGGAMMTALQSAGMGEGWSDFYALSLLSEPADNPNACYASGAYIAFMLGDLRENYYYGYRRYPYSTDMTKNPLTFKDIDPDQADPHLGVPKNPLYGSYFYEDPAEVHAQGEVWCMMLWEGHARLVDNYGWDEGNRMMLQMVTDGMKLCPVNPTYIEARDAILQADLADYGGNNRADLWIAFAKRGLGYSALAPPADTTSGVVEAYDLPPDVVISPPTGVLQAFLNPADNSTVLGGTTTPVYVRVRDGVGVTNATVTGLLNGTTPVTFNNAGSPPDARSGDSMYSANLLVPSLGTNLTFTVIATAPGKVSTTNTVHYYIALRPVNDFFATAIKINAAGGVSSANNRFANVALESGEPAHDNVPSATQSLWWSWTPNSNTKVLIDTGGSRFNTILAVYTGSSVSNLTPVASTLTQPQQRKGYVLFDAKKNQPYQIAVASISTNNAGYVRLNIAPGATPDLTAPIVSVSRPASGLIVTDNTIDIVATAYDPGPLSSGIDSINVTVFPITGGNSVIQSVSSTATNRVALVSGRNTVNVTATDGVGNISDAIQLTIIYRPVLVPNDHFTYAALLPGASGTVTAKTGQATREPGEPQITFNTGGHSVWWQWKAPADGTILLSTENSDFDTLLGMYQGSRVDSLSLVAQNDDAFDGSKFSKVQQGVRSNQLYYVAVDGFNGATGTVQLAYSFSPSKLFQINLQASAGGTVKEHGVGLVDVLADSNQTLTGVPQDQYEFAGWEGDYVTTANPVAVAVHKNMTLRATFRPVLYTDDFESGGLGHLSWATGGNAPWSVQSTMVATGRYAARSGSIAAGQTSSLSFTGNFRAGAVAFDLKVSSEPTWDVFSFLIDGVSVASVSGEAAWTRYSFALTAGTHTLEWRYTKDPQNTGGLDAAFLDNLSAPLLPAIDPTVRPRLFLMRTPQGTYELRLTGQTNQVYRISQTLTAPPGTNAAWVHLLTDVAAYGEIRLFLEPEVLSNSFGFYRALAR